MSKSGGIAYLLKHGRAPFPTVTRTEMPRARGIKRMADGGTTTPANQPLNFPGIPNYEYTPSSENIAPHYELGPDGQMRYVPGRYFSGAYGGGAYKPATAGAGTGVGGGGSGSPGYEERGEGGANPRDGWDKMSDAEKAGWYAEHPNFGKVSDFMRNLFSYTALGKLSQTLNPGGWTRAELVSHGIAPASADRSLGDYTLGSPIGTNTGPATSIDASGKTNSPTGLSVSLGSLGDYGLGGDLGGKGKDGSTLGGDTTGMGTGATGLSVDKGALGDYSLGGDLGGGVGRGAAGMGRGATGLSVGDVSAVQAGKDTTTEKGETGGGGGGGGGGGCFLTTAAVEHMGQEDSGDVLNTLRHFRDTYMLRNKDQSKDVAWYYKNAPKIVEALNESDDGTAYKKMYQQYILPAYEAIKDDDPEKAYEIYKNGINYAVKAAGLSKKDLTPRSGGNGISDLDAARAARDSAVDTAVHTPAAYAAGGIAALAGGGQPGQPRLLSGGGTGLSDDIPAVIGHNQPARLADGEFVVSADVVSALGGGSTKAGAKKLYDMMDRIRQNAHGTKKQVKKVNERKVLPA